MKTMINWFQVPCTDFDRAVTFYETIFDIQMPRMQDPAGNSMAPFFAPDEGIAGAVNSDPNLTPSSEGCRIYLNADAKLDDVVGRTEAAGGSVVAAREAIGEWGYIAVIIDTEGNTIGLHSSK